MVLSDTCPVCGSHRYKKNGHTHHGKQQHQWTTGGRQCTAPPLDWRMAPEQRQRIEQRLCERISLRGSAVPWVSVSRGSGTCWWKAF
jgi:hypothetical protein